MAHIKDVKIGTNTYLIEPTVYAATAGTEAITANIPNFALDTGVVVTLKITQNNAAGATLNITSTGAKPIKYKNANIAANALSANRFYSFLYDGTAWQLIGELNEVTGVKGSAEANYRTGQVNLTPANIGAVAKTGDTMTGSLNIKPATGEGGQLNLHAATEDTTHNGIALDNLNGIFRVFGIASADGTTKTGVGTPLEIDPYAKTIKGGYTITGDVIGYLKWQTTSITTANTIYDFGVYVKQGSADTSTTPSGNAYYNILNIPYRKASGNSKADYAWSIASSTSADNRLFFRTSNADTYGAWQEVAHAPVGTAAIGSATQPVYMTATGVITAGTTYAGGTAVTLNNSNKAGSTASFYAPTAGGTANTQALVGNGATSAPKWVNISPSISITAGTSSAAPSINVTVLGQSGAQAQAITTASTSVYGVTKLQDGISSTSTALAATANAAYTASRNSLHTLATTTKYYITGTTSTTTSTGGDSFDTGVYVTATTGELSAVKHSFNVSGTEKATMQYNNDIESIVFSFV